MATGEPGQLLKGAHWPLMSGSYQAGVEVSGSTPLEFQVRSRGKVLARRSITPTDSPHWYHVTFSVRYRGFHPGVAHWPFAFTPLPPRTLGKPVTVQLVADPGAHARVDKVSVKAR